MTLEDEPPRLKTLARELPGELSRALESSADESPTPEELATLSAQLRRSLAAERRAAVTSPRARQPITRGAVGGIALTFALGAGAGVLVSAGAAWVSGRFSSEPLPAPRVSSDAAPHVAPAPPAPAAPATPVTEPIRAPDSAPSATRLESGLERLLPSRAEPVAAHADSGDVPPATDGDELSVLARAQALVATDPTGALALAEEHTRRFPRGELVQEREVVAIGALAKLGRKTEASARAASFHRRFPTSAHRRRVDVLLGITEPSSNDHN